MTAGVLPVWWDDAADGPTNMAADELLAEESARHGGLLIRLYAWSAPSVSLGAFQPIAEAEACGDIAGLPLVRRPSGGGAIVHGTDLTYAAAVPKSHAWGGTPQALYDALHLAMVAALADCGLAARLHVPSAVDPPADALFCFSRRAPGDVVAAAPDAAPDRAAPKIMGSAQRRLGATVLQHGSLLLSTNPAVGPAAGHAGLAEVAPSAAVSAARLAEAWIGRVAETIGFASLRQPAPFLAGREAAIADRAVRFRDPRWTRRR